MGIKPTVKLKNNYYGVSKLQKDGTYKFCPLGKLPVLEEVLECVEDGNSQALALLFWS